MKKTVLFLSRVLTKRQKGKPRRRRTTITLLLLPVTAMILIPLLSAFSAFADGEGFSYQITSVSPSSGSVHNDQRIDVMYGEPLVLDVSVSQPCTLAISMQGFASRQISHTVDSVSDTQFRVTFSPDENRDYEGNNTAYLYFKGADDTRIAECRINLQAKAFRLRSVTVDKNNIKLRVGESYRLHASTDPASAPAGVDMGVTWESENSTIAEVSADCVVTAKELGHTSVAAFGYPSSTFLYDTCTVDVVESVPAESVAVSYIEGSGGGFADGVLTLTEEESACLTAEVTPDNSQETVTWESSDNNVVTVDDSGSVTAVSMGSATVSARAGEKSASVTVRVLRHVPGVPADCSNNGTTEYWQDKDGKKYADSAGASEITDTLIPSPGHDWGEWTGDPVQERVCGNDANHTEKRLNPAMKFAATVGDHSQYTLGSKDVLELTIDRIDRENKNVFTYFTNGGQAVVTDNNDYSKTLTSDDFDAESGSLKLTLKADYLEGLATGTYSLTASFKVAEEYDPIVSEPVSFTIVKPSSSPSSPATGESGMMTTVSLVLMLIAAFGAVYTLMRRKNAQA